MENLEVIYAYTRKDAIEDGILVELDEAKLEDGKTGKELRLEAGVMFPICFTFTLFEKLNPNEADRKCGQSLAGRYWDVLTIFKFEISALTKKQAKVNQFNFKILVLEGRKGELNELEMKVMLGAEDDGKPALTFMLPDED